MTADHEQRTFERNLAALRGAQPKLAERVALPVDGAHVEPGPPARLLVHKAWVPLAPGDVEPPKAERLLVVGVGLGELVERALARSARVVAWDRDPWLLRLALERVDVADALASGALRLALGTDLCDVDPALLADPGARLAHPLLGELYRRDVAFAQRAASAEPPRRAALATGGLLVESLGDALERAGFAPWPLEIRRLSLEELDQQMARVAPELVVAVNYTNGLAELAARHGAKLACWEIDPTTTPPRLDTSAANASDAGVFTWRASGVEAFRAAGFARASHLPIGADVELRRPVELDEGEHARYAADVSYVGASLMRNAGEFRERFLALWAAAGIDRQAGEALLSEALVLQRANPTRFLIPELLEQRAPALGLGADGEDPALLLGELAAAEKRLTYVANLGRLGVHAWGDAGWQPLEKHGVKYRGPAGHGAELTRIYNATRVNVDVGRVYQNDIVTLRTFDVLACGAFALVEHTAELGDLFEVGREVVSYRTLNELLEKAAHYAGNVDEADEIAERGLRAVRERHSVDLRLAEMLRSLGVE